MPLISTGAFMRVLGAIAAAEEPVRIDPRAITWEGEGQDRRPIVDNVEHWLWKSALSGQTFAELGVPWAHRERDKVLVRARLSDAEVAVYRDGRGTIPTSSPRPYLHPVRTQAGVVVSAHHPADHDWHNGVGMAIPDVNGTHFWGGGTYVHGQGYVLLDNHGVIVGESPELEDDAFTQELKWIAHDGSAALHEHDRSAGCHRSAELEIDLRVPAACRRRHRAQLAGQQGPHRWWLRRFLLAVPGLRERRGVH